VLGAPTTKLQFSVAPIGQTQVILLEYLIGAAAMRRLLSLAALVFALWAIDAYAFNGRYWVAAGEEVNYCVKILNDGVQNFVSRIRP
jgi:hypothetical protein